MATTINVADAAGVSTATVSRVVNNRASSGPPHIPEIRRPGTGRE